MDGKERERQEARERHLEFQQVIEGLFLVALGSRRTARLDARLKEAGLDLSLPLEPAYPSMRYVGWLKITAEELFPELDEAQGLRQLGAEMMGGYTNTLIGRAIFGVMRVIGIRRAFDRITRSFRSGDNYTEAQAEFVGPTEALVRFNEVHGVPTYIEGALEKALRMLGADDGRVVLESCPEGYEAVFRATWSG
ncbi:MAG TPA: DUF2378 family protein [Myxococcaceae bacterium]|nr:DUF2378 family protein [Myxococcaceae bacterium]